jgi:uncharacterized membrane protein (UPF0182 family)
MIGVMEDDPLFDKEVIDVAPRKRRLWLWILLGIILLAFLTGSQLVNIYVDSLWFSSIGYASVYWYKFRLGGLLFVVFLVATFFIFKLPLSLLGRFFPELTERTKLRLASVQDIREVNFLAFFFRPAVWLIALGGGLISAFSMSRAWPDFALYLNSQPAGARDPIFDRDASFYLFKLPALELLTDWLHTIAFVLLIITAITAGYVWYLERVRNEVNTQTERRATAAISAAGAFLALTFGLNTFFDRYDLLQSRHELFTGINYTDANVRLRVMNVLLGFFLLAAVALAVNAFTWRRLRLLVWIAALGVVISVLGLGIIPSSVQSFSVKPNELAKESPYIEHNIKQTRQGFGLDRFEVRPFTPAPTLTVQKIKENRDTLDNVRLWDRRALEATLGQIQEIRTYYEFQLPDVDRYMLNGKLREVMLAAREMNVEQLPEQSRNWINRHLVYTHGYGVTMNTVNEFTPEGQPHLVLKNMPVESDAPEVKVTRPEIYFGENSNQHVYVHTKAQQGTQPEFNYPAADNNEEGSYTTYEGGEGIQVGGLFRKLALSIYLGDGTNLLFSDYINSDSRVLMHRNVLDRVRQVAPFILFENDPYIVINREGKLFWIIDGFTTTNRYPYATEYTVAGREVNYIRNSVKAVVDAYEGTVNFYVFEEDNDPIIKVYQHIFPALFHPKSEMPDDLLAHVRYPSLLVSAQAQAYTLYHMQNPQTFYNHEDLWAVATSDTPTQQGQEAEVMEPYHVLMMLPSEPNATLEFLNILPFTPSGGRSNMIGWMGARNDGANYGRVAVYDFPKNITVNGPAQIRARVNQDSVLSQQMTLWNQKGSELLRGNLLVIPLADSLLYVEAFFLQSQGGQSKLPELRQVAVATQDRLAPAKTFDEALRLLFPELGSQQQTTPSQPPTQQAKNQAPSQPSSQQTTPPTSGDLDRFARQAQQLITDYEQLTAAGKHREAGEKLDELKRTLTEMNRKRGGQ